MDRIEYQQQQQHQDTLINKFVYWWAYNAVTPNVVTRIMVKVYARVLKMHLDKYGKIWDISYEYWLEKGAESTENKSDD